MNPNNQNEPTPPVLPPSARPSNQTMSSSDTLPPLDPRSNDEIFVIKKTEKKPLDKKSLVFVLTLAVLGVMFLTGVLVFALISSANGLADDYLRLEAKQIKKIDSPLANLEPSAVINQRNLDDPLRQITLSEQAQPSLESVLFIGAWSEKYQNTQKTQATSQKHYVHIKTYAEQLKQLLNFDSAARGIFNQEPNLTATLNPKDSFSIRSLSGSYNDFAKQINKTASPPQNKKIKSELVGIYEDKAAAYLAWASAVEQNDPAAALKAQASISATSGKAVALVDDQNYIDAFTPSYQSLVNEHKKLKNLLGS